MKSSRQILENYRNIGTAKCSLSAGKMILSGTFAGLFIAFGAFGSQIVGASVQDPGLAKLLGALVFPVGLTLVLCVGTELFTGNSLLAIPLLEKKITLGGMLKNWSLVYLGNLIGSLIMAVLAVYSNLPAMYGGNLANVMVSAAVSKCTLTFGEALMRGILCNVLVCLAVWVSFAADEQAGKILGLYLPTMLFVLCGFEHCVANMYFIPAGMMASSHFSIAAEGVSFASFLIHNLIPVTIGNVIGGAIFVGGGFYTLFGDHERS